MNRLENHQLDVIVQVRKLGEGFDHPFLAVAAVFSIFRNLSPFVQFVGRIMRVIEHNSPGHPLNNGVVVFHAGANVARQWEDFQQYSEADQEYFDQLLPIEGLDFDNSEDLQVSPVSSGRERVEVKAQTDIRLEEIPLVKDDPEALAALKVLQDRGYTSDQVKQAYEQLNPVPVTRVRLRQAKRLGLDMRIKTEAARILKERDLNPEGNELDRQRLGRSNLIVLKAAIDRSADAAVGRRTRERSEFTQEQLDQIDEAFDTIVGQAISEVFNGD
jgi:hypothetical protein